MKYRGTNTVGKTLSRYKIIILLYSFDNRVRLVNIATFIQKHNIIIMSLYRPYELTEENIQ